MRGENAAELAADIEERVSLGSLRPGDRLPPVRALATELGLAPNTVASAYRRLGERGIVVGRGRAGTFVAPRPPVAMPAEAAPPPGALDASTGNPDPELLPDLERVTGVLAGPAGLYGEASMDEQLAGPAAGWLGADGVQTDHLTVVAGALDGIERVLGAHLRPGDRVAVEDPAYASVIDLLGAMGLVPVPVDVDDEGPRPGALAEALGRGAAAAIITPRAQNPFGSAIPAGRAGALREVLADHLDVVVIEDDHASSVAGAPMHTIAGERDRWATVRSVAKTYGPDLRLAVLAGDPITVRRVDGRLRIGPGWVSHLLQQIAASLMTDPAVSKAVKAAAEHYRRRRTALIGRLAAEGIGAHGASGLNVWVPVADEAAAVAGLRDRGVVVRPGTRFRIRSRPGIRVTTAALSASQIDEVASAIIAILRPGRAATRSG